MAPFPGRDNSSTCLRLTNVSVRGVDNHVMAVIVIYVLENTEIKDSYDSNLDELDLLVTPLFDVNEVKFFDPGGDSEGDILYLESFLRDDTTPNLHPEDCLDFEASRARGFVHRPLELLSLAYGNLIS
nr:hypothetical protein [Tanacetum cinerariifolium]